MLAKLVHLKTLADGEVLLPEGARDPLVHVVVEGRVQVVKDTVRGRTLLHTLKPGDLVGELSFMDDEPRYGTLLASGPTKVLCLSRADFETLVETERRVVYKVMRAIMRVAHRVQRDISRDLKEFQNYVSQCSEALIGFCSGGVDLIGQGHQLQWVKQFALRGRGRQYDFQGVCGNQRLVVSCDHLSFLANDQRHSLAKSLIFFRTSNWRPLLGFRKRHG